MYKDTDLERLHSGIQLYAWHVVYDRNHYFGFGPIPILSADTVNDTKISVSDKKVSALIPILKLDLGFGSRFRKLISVAH